MRRFVFVLSLLGLLVGCNRSNPTYEAFFLDTSAREDFALSDIVESVDVLFLNETDDVLVGKVSDVRYANNRWYLLDVDEGRSVVSVFDKEGNALGQLNRQGRGPKEYLEIASFDVCPKTGDIYLGCYPPKVMVFDKELNLKQEIECEAPYMGIAKCDDGLMLYGFVARDSVGVDYMKLGSGEEVSVERVKSWHREKNATETIGKNTFMRSAENIYFYTQNSDSLYLADDGNLSVVAAIDYPNREQIREYRRTHSIYDLPPMERKGYFVPRVHYAMERGDGLWLHYSNVLFGYGVVAKEGVKNYSSKCLDATSLCGNRLVNIVEAFHYDPENFDPNGWLQGVKVNHIKLNDTQRESGNKVLIIYNLRD